VSEAAACALLLHLRFVTRPGRKSGASDEWDELDGSDNGHGADAGLSVAAPIGAETFAKLNRGFFGECREKDGVGRNAAAGDQVDGAP
jgi:hypothetical protein